MIKSMTGFGRSEAGLSFGRLILEARSLNSKQMDLNLRLPAIFRERENALRSEAVASLQRGKVDVDVRIEWDSDKKKQSIDRDTLLAYHSEIKAIEKDIGQRAEDMMSVLLRLPDIYSSEQQELEESDWDALMKTMKHALLQLDDFRSTEGKKLEKDITEHLNNIVQGLKQLRQIEPERATDVRNRLEAKLRDLQINTDRDRFEQELIYYLEKLDINEEMVRLASHCKYFTETMADKDKQGKKLGFIAQEMGREINTIGSKANHADIQKLVVEMKDELEKIKEQLLNVL